MKKIIIIVVLLILFQLGFSVSSWTISCTCRSAYPFSYCASNYNCGSQATLSGCRDCGYIGDTYLSGCKSIPVVSGTCTCNAGWENCDGGNSCEWEIGDSITGGLKAANCQVTCNAGYCASGTACVDNQFNNNYCGSSCTACASDEFCYLGACYKKNSQSQYQGDCNFLQVSVCSSNSNIYNDPYRCWLIANPTVAPVCNCQTNYKNCDLNAGTGCESNIMCDDSHCGACNAPVESGKFCFEGTSKFINGQNEFRLTSAQWNQVLPVLNNENLLNLQNELKATPLTSSICAGLEKMLFTCNSIHPNKYGNCDSNVLNGCETPLSANIDNCGACGYSCAANGPHCSGYALGGTDACVYSCNNGVCSALTKSDGLCENNAQCQSNICRLSVDSASNNIDNGRGWCCPSATDCGYDGACYSNGQAMPELVNGNYYYCQDGIWNQVSRGLDLSKLINYHNDKQNMDSINYFSDLGPSRDCDNDNYAACQKNGPYYSYNYCFSYNVAFDGMFSIESQNRVPIKVSEQDLYNPYFRPELEAGIFNAADCDNGVFNCGADND